MKSATSNVEGSDPDREFVLMDTGFNGIYFSRGVVQLHCNPDHSFPKQTSSCVLSCFGEM